MIIFYFLMSLSVLSLLISMFFRCKYLKCKFNVQELYKMHNSFAAYFLIKEKKVGELNFEMELVYLKRCNWFLKAFYVNSAIFFLILLGLFLTSNKSS
jgi:hypothetical protein